MPSQKKISSYLLKMGLFSLLPNLIGASIVVIIFNFFHFSSTHIIRTKNLNLSILLTVLIFVTVILFSYQRFKKIRILLDKLIHHSASKDEINDLKLRVLNSPYFGLMMTVLCWFGAGLILGFSAYLQGNSLSGSLFLYFEISVIGGSFAAIISFYFSDSFIRKMAHDFFPDGNFSEIKKTKNIRFYIRMIFAFWIGGMLPVILSIFYSKQYISQILTYGPDDIIALKYKVLMIFVTALSVIMSILSSGYFKRQMGQPLILLEQSMDKVKTGDFQVSLPVEQKDEVGNVFAGFNEMTKGLKEREQIKDAFGKFVSPHIRDEILKGNMELGGQKKEASVLFCDIRKFTTISEKLSAAEVVDLLNSYFNEMVQPIFKNGGVLDKFIGDALMAVFGVPGHDPKHAENALKTALTMLKKLESFNEIRKMSGQEPIEIGIGLNSGELIAGNIGSSERMEYTVIGDTVNIASRLETLTKEYHQPIIISEYTYACLSQNSEFQFKELGDVTVKGRTKPFKIYSPVF